MGKSGVSGSRIFHEFDPFDEVGMFVPKAKREEAKKDIAEFVKEQVLSYVGDGESPVSGGKWKRSLSPAYKKIKAKDSSVTFANMELSGDMLDALTVRSTRGDKLVIEVTGETEAAKADGHNNISGKSSLPARQFIPKSSQTFKRDIMDGIKEIIKRYADGDEQDN